MKVVPLLSFAVFYFISTKVEGSNQTSAVSPIQSTNLILPTTTSLSSTTAPAVSTQATPDLTSTTTILIPESTTPKSIPETQDLSSTPVQLMTTTTTTTEAEPSSTSTATLSSTKVAVAKATVSLKSSQAANTTAHPTSAPTSPKHVTTGAPKGHAGKVSATNGLLLTLIMTWILGIVN